MTWIAVDAAAAVGQPLQRAAVMYSSSNFPVADTDCAAVGTQDISVQVTELTVMEQLSLLQTELSALKRNQNIMAKPLISNTATQVLNIACGASKFKETRTDYFAQLGADDPGLQFISEETGVNVKKLIEAADSVIERRNNNRIHNTTLEALDRQVAEHAELMNPVLRP